MHVILLLLKQPVFAYDLVRFMLYITLNWSKVTTASFYTYMHETSGTYNFMPCSAGTHFCQGISVCARQVPEFSQGTPPVPSMFQYGQGPTNLKLYKPSASGLVQSRARPGSHL